MKRWKVHALRAVAVGVLISAASLLAFVGEVRADELPPIPSMQTVTFTSYSKPGAPEGIQRSYYFFAPVVDEDPKLPLLINLHGWGVDPYTGDWIGGEGRFSAFAQANHFILVSPVGEGLSWNAGPCCAPAWPEIDDVKFISEVIDHVAANHRVDRARVYAIGMSNGAFLAYRLACERPDLIAAVGSVAGALLSREGIGVECDPGRPVPVIEIHGTLDWLVPWEGGLRPEGEGELNLWALSTLDTVGYWAMNNSCSLETDQKTTFAGPKDVTCNQFRACKSDAIVELCTVLGGGHNWPGSAIDLYEDVDKEYFWWWGYMTREIATHEVLWRFVSRYHQPPAAE